MPDPVKKPISTIELLKGFQSSQTPLPSVEQTIPKAKDPWGSDVVDYDEFVKGMAGNAGGLQMPEQDDVTQLKSQALTTRESLDNARNKLEEDYARSFTFPEMSYMQPGGQGTYNFESKEQSQAFYNLQDKKKKLDLAISYLDRALNTPEEKKGAGKKAFQNELHNIISAGIAGMLDDIITARAAKQLSKGEQDDINEALIDAYGRLNQLNEIASKEVPRYRRASSIAGSIPYMEQFLMTGGIGTGAAGVAEKAGQAFIKKGITSKLGQAAVKRFVEPIIEGGVSMIGRVPIAPMTYANIAEESIGKLKEDGGKFYVDPDTMPSISKAIGKGVYNSAKEIFSESLGGMVALPKGLFPKALQEAISPAVKDFFKMVGMNNPFGEHYEELVSQALGGDNPFDPQFLKDLLVTIPVITGGFSALSIPAVASNLKVNADNRKVIEKFGLNSVNEVRDLIKANDSDGLVEKMGQLASVPGATQKDHSNLLRYAASLVQDQAAKEFENPAPQAPMSQEEQDVAKIKDIGQRLQFNGTGEIVFAQDGELEPGQQPLVIISERDEPLTGKKVSIAVDLNELKQANWDITQINPKFMPGDQLKQRKNVPVQQWIDDELNNYYTVKQQSDTMTAQMEAPVQEGETVTLGDKTFNVTAVGTEGVQLNEIDLAGNITGATLNVTPDQYVNVFGQPAPIEGTEQVQAQPEAATAQPEAAQQVQADPEPQLPMNKQGEIEYEKIQDPKAYAFGLTQEFGEEAPTVLDELIAEKTDALAKAKKASDAIQRARKTKSLNAEIARLNEVKAFFTPQTQTNDQKNITGLPGEIREGKEPVQAELVEETGRKETEASGVLQKQEEVTEQEQPVVEQPTAQQPSAPDETAPVEAEMQKAGEVVSVEKKHIEVTDPEQVKAKISEIEASPDYPQKQDDLTFYKHKLEIIKQDSGEVVSAAELAKSGQKSPEAQLIKANNEVEPKPTEAQKEAGNFPKGHFKWQGMDISIENPAMSVRSGVDSDGEKWQQLMHNSYGYFRRTKGKDGDQIDVFLGDNLNSDRVFVVDQINPKTGQFDEIKTLIGFNNIIEATNAYLSNYEEGWKGMGDISETDIETFKKWIDEGDTKKPYKTAGAWVKVYPGVSTMVTNETEMPEPEEQKIQILRGQGNKDLRGMEQEFSKIPGGNGEEAVAKSDTGQNKQQRELLQGQLPVDGHDNTGAKQEERKADNLQGKNNDSGGLGERNRNPPSDFKATTSGLSLEHRENVINTNKSSSDNIQDAGIQRGGKNDGGMGQNQGDQLPHTNEQDNNTSLASGESAGKKLIKPDFAGEALENTPRARALTEFKKGDLVKNIQTKKEYEVVSITKVGKSFNAALKEKGQKKISNFNGTRVQWIPVQKEVTIKTKPKKQIKFSPDSRKGKLLSRSPQTFKEAILQFFVGGGRVSHEDFIRYLGFSPIKEGYIWAVKGKADGTGEQGKRFDAFWEDMPEQWGRTGDKEDVDDIAAILKDYPGIEKMMDALAKLQSGEEEIPANMIPPYEDDEFINADLNAIDDEVEDVVKDIMDNPEVKSIIEDYMLENGTIDVDKLLSKIDSDPNEFTIFPFALKKSELIEFKKRLEDEQRKRQTEKQGSPEGNNQAPVQDTEKDANGGDQGNEAGVEPEERPSPEGNEGEAPQGSQGAEPVQIEPKTPKKPDYKTPKGQAELLKYLIDAEDNFADNKMEIAKLKGTEGLSPVKRHELKQRELVQEQNQKRLDDLQAQVDDSILSKEKQSEIRKLIKQTNAVNAAITTRILRLQDERDAKEKALQKRNEVFGDRKAEEDKKSGVQDMFAGDHLFTPSSDILKAALKPFNEGIKKAEEDIDRNNQLLDEKIDLVIRQVQSKIDWTEVPVEKDEKAETPKEDTPINPLNLQIVEVSKPVQKIEDFGEHISGAKKEIRGQIRKQLDTTDDDLLNNSISKVLPVVDYKNLVDSGTATVEEAAFLAWVRLGIWPKPKSPYKQKAWLRTVNAYKVALGWILEPAKFKASNDGLTLIQVIEKSADVYMVGRMKDYIKTLIAVGFPNEVTSLKNYEIRYFEERKTKDKEGNIITLPSRHSIIKDRIIVADFKTHEEALAGLKYILTTESEKSGSVKFDIWRESGQKGLFVGKKVGSGKYITLAKGFDKVSEARKYIENHQEELEKMLEEKKIIPFERPESRGPRIGKDHRKGENITPEKFSETFGFRGVQFGNYVEQLRRQEDLNEAYDALMDLADVLGVPTRALSLGGQLGIAFGARGTGGKQAAAAHYEPDQIVINLTKGNGPGSLAHEWFHAADNYFSRARGRKLGYITDLPVQLINRDGSKDEAIRPEVIDAFKNVVNTIHKSGLRLRSKELDKKRSKDYWSTTIEMGARSFESYVRSKLAEKEGRNDYLVSFKDMVDYIVAAGGAKEAYPYPTAEESEIINAAFDKLFTTLQTRVDENNVTLLYETAEEYIRESLDGYSSEAQRRTAVKQAISNTGQLNLGSGQDYRGSLFPKVQPRTVLEGFKESGYIDFIGQKINGPQDIADLWSIHRSPNIEKSHLIFVKDGVVVGSTAVTLNRIGQSAFPPAEVVYNCYKLYKADGVYLLHNHPSGIHKPSVADVMVTNNLNEKLKPFGVNIIGHVVIDTDKFSFIDVNNKPLPEDIQYVHEVEKYMGDGNVAEFEYKNPVPKLFHERESLIPPGEVNGSDSRMIEIARALLTENKYRGAVIYLASNLDITAYDVFPEGATPEDIVRIAKEGIKNNLGRNVIFIHDGSFMRLTWMTRLPAETLDVINAGNKESQWFQKEKDNEVSVKDELEVLFDRQADYKDITSTPAFKKWFGNSKVVDENGRPLVVYHGTIKDFDEFKIDKIGSRLDKGIFGFGFYFTDSPYQADMYGNGSYENGNIMPVYLSIKNPYDFDNNKNNPDHVKLWGDWGTIDKGKEEAFTEWLKGRGYDGVIVKHRNQIVAFSPSQIKSATGNNGNFDPNSPNITEEPKRKYEFATDYLVNEPQTPLARGTQAYAEKKAAREGKEVLQGVREYIQDLNLPIRKFEEEVLKRGGKQDNTSKPYRDSFLSFGRQEKLYEDFVEKKMKPVLKVVADITKKSGIDGGEILPYIISKHGIERNEVMRGEELREWTEAHPDASFDEIEAKREELKDKDYAGVMAFDLDKNGKPSGNYTNPDDLARDIVNEFEGKVDRTLIDDLWTRIKEASAATLDTWEASNQISDKQRQEYYAKFRYFVPLRGWRHDAAKELTYTKGEGFSRSLKHAEGRKSLADNPLAYMQQVQFQAIGEQVDNEVKTSMLNLIIKNLGNNEINDLATIKKLYYVKVALPDGSYEWEPTTTRPAPELFESGDAKTKIYREHEKLRKPIQAMEHEVWVKKPGGDMVIVFKNKNLKVGQALNKQNYMYRTIFGNVYDARDINKVMSLMGRANNALKALYTSWNVVFPFTNFMRDFQEASITQSIKMGKGGKVISGYTGAFPAIYRRLKGTPDFTKKIDRDLEEFYNLGGATGYTHNKTIDEIEKEFEKDLKRMVSQGTITGSLTGASRKIFSAVEAWNRLFEDATRFSVYLSSLAAGNSKEDAAYDAKEASVNFNRKGKGSKAWDAYFAFFNVAIQSLQKNFKLGKDYPAKFAGIATSFVMLGFLEALMNAITDDDDDDKSYYNLNPYMRQNYLVIPLPGNEGGKANKYLSVPLPQFWRGFKSVGAIAFDVITKKLTVKEGIMDALGNFGSALLPVDIGGFYNSGEFSFSPIVPTTVKPVVEILENKNYMGYSIVNEPFTREQEKYLAPAGLGKTNVSPAAKFFTDLLFRWGGGENKYKYYYDEQQDRDRKVPGILDINPSVVEHLFKGYTGGSGGVFSDLITTIKQAADPDTDIDFRNVPFVNRFVRKTPEAKWNIIREYYDNRDDKAVGVFVERDLEKQAEQTGDWSKLEKRYSNQYIQEYKEIFRMYEAELDDAAKDKSFDLVEGSKRAVDLMEQCNSDIAKLKERYNKK